MTNSITKFSWSSIKITDVKNEDLYLKLSCIITVVKIIAYTIIVLVANNVANLLFSLYD